MTGFAFAQSGGVLPRQPVIHRPLARALHHQQQEHAGPHAVGQARPAKLVGAADEVDGKAVHLGLARLPKHRRDGKPRQEGQGAVGQVVHLLHNGGQPALVEVHRHVWRSAGRHGVCGGGRIQQLQAGV